MTVFLIGFMGAGKSYWGEKLAKHLNYTYIDTDFQIETDENSSISSLFKLKGERYFREKEREWVLKYDSDNTIVSTGGGLPIYNNNISELNNKGLTVFIDEPFEVCFDRIKKSNRPLVKSNKELELIFEKRLPIYKEAKITIQSPQNISDFIEKLV